MLNQKRLTVEKMKFERERNAEKLQKLKKDRETLVVRAPTDGIVFYGKCVRGQFSSASLESRLQRGGNLMPDEIIMTIVQPRPLFVRASVEEKDLERCPRRPQSQGHCQPRCRILNCPAASKKCRRFRVRRALRCPHFCR